MKTVAKDRTAKQHKIFARVVMTYLCQQPGDPFESIFHMMPRKIA